MPSDPRRNEVLVRYARDTMFYEQESRTAERPWPEVYLRHSAGIGSGRDGSLDLIRSAPTYLAFEDAPAVHHGDVVRPGRVANHGQPTNWTAVDAVRIQDELLPEHSDVLRDATTKAEPRRDLAILGDQYPARREP